MERSMIDGKPQISHDENESNKERFGIMQQDWCKKPPRKHGGLLVHRHISSSVKILARYQLRKGDHLAFLDEADLFHKIYYTAD